MHKILQSLNYLRAESMTEPSIEQAMQFEQAFRHVHIGIRKGMIKQVKDELGIEFTDFPVLYLIKKGFTSPSAIKDRMQMSASMVSHMVDRSLKAELINRELDPKDSRRFLLSLTDKGERLIKRMNEHYMLRIQSAGMSGEELEQLSKQLTKLARAFGATEECE